MKTLLIAEDEKIIRQGLKAMIERSGVDVEEILECSNGEEALKIINHKEIDVLFTDIRMPKMDGISLLNTIQGRKDAPEIVVISGYDDFSYAVEALKCGAREYLLKPINREDIYKVMKNFEEIVTSKKVLCRKIEVIDDMLEQQIKYIFMNETVSSKELKRFSEGFIDHWINTEAYNVLCLYQGIECIRDREVIICEIDQNIIVVCREKDVKQLEEELCQKNIGISSSYKGIRNLRIAYEQAILARRYAYMMNVPCLHYYDIPFEKNTEIEDKMIKEIIQLVGTERRADFEEAFETILGEKCVERLIYDVFEKLMQKLMHYLLEAYGSVIDRTEFEKIESFYQYADYKSYQVYLRDYLLELNEKICCFHEKNKSVGQMKEAIDYINKNYQKDLDMAMVSNHISMNYSCFSQIFKEYTGTKFVNYIKEIRINKAKELLSSTQKKVAEIGYAVGYENEKHFMKVFKSVTGISPTEYRKNNELVRGKR